MIARIFQPAKAATQSGAGVSKAWVLELEGRSPARPDTLMGWTGAGDTDGQVRLTFDTCEEAIAFARAHNIPHRVIEPRAAKRVLKAYGDNFAFHRKEPWSH